MVSTRAFRDYYSRERPSRKLQSKRIGPFRILKLIGKNAVRLELPATMRVHPAINVSHTSRFFQQPEDISRARGPPPPPVFEHNDDAYYDIDGILNHRLNRHGYQFLVLWKGYPTHEASWEPTSSFLDEHGDIHEALQDYLQDKSIDAGDVIPPRRQ